jgi:uncharacterized protein YcnI
VTRVVRGAAVALLTLLLAPALAAAHARVSPATSLAGELQLYSLAVPTEKTGASTDKIVLSLPKSFSIDSFVPSPGWHRSVQQTGSGDSAVVQKVTWTGGRTPSGEDSLFQFLAQPATAGQYRFTVQQTYADGSIVNWTGAESSADPAPTIRVLASATAGGGGGGSTTLEIVAIVLAALALAASGLALVGRGEGGRPLT